MPTHRSAPRPCRHFATWCRCRPTARWTPGRRAAGPGRRLRDSDGEVRIAAHLGMIRLGRLPRRRWRRPWARRSRRCAACAAETLQKLGPDARTAAPDLVAALRDADAEVRDGAGWALEAIDPELRAAVPALRQALAAPPKPIPLPDRPRSRHTGRWPSWPPRRRLIPVIVRPRRCGNCRCAAANRPWWPWPWRRSARIGATRTLGREMLLKCLDGRPDARAEDDAARRLKLARRLLEEGKAEAAQRTSAASSRPTRAPAPPRRAAGCSLPVGRAISIEAEGWRVGAAFQR